MEDSSEGARTLYCGNLDERVTEELLYELCLQVGPIEKITIPSCNGKQRNFGFVTYKHAVSVPYAVKLLSEEALFNRKLVFRARGQQNDSPKHSPHGNDERRRSLNQHSPLLINSNVMNRQQSPGIYGQSPPFMNFTHFQGFGQSSNQMSSPRIYMPNRFQNWKS